MVKIIIWYYKNDVLNDSKLTLQLTFYNKVNNATFMDKYSMVYNGSIPYDSSSNDSILEHVFHLFSTIPHKYINHKLLENTHLYISPGDIVQHSGHKYILTGVGFKKINIM